MVKNVNPVRNLKLVDNPDNQILLNMNKGISNRVKLKIGFDFDGVIVDHSQTKIRKVKEIFGLKIEPGQTPGYCLRRMIGQDNYRQIQKYIYGPGTSQGKVMKGAVSALKELKNLGCKMFIVSRRQPAFRPGALAWIEKNIPGIFNKSQIFFVKRDEDKDRILKKLNVKIYLDDKVSVLRKLASVSKKYLYDQYNLKDNFNLKDITPADSWRQFLEHIRFR